MTSDLSALTRQSLPENPSSWFGTYMLARREVARFMNVWAQTLLPPVIQAALFLLIFGAALGSRIGSFDGVPYLAFIAPGIILQNVIQNAYSNTSSSLFDARRARYVEDPLTSPISDHQIVLAYIAGAIVRGALIGLLTLAIAFPFSDAWSVNVPFFLLMLVLSCTLFGYAGLYAGIRASRWDHIFIPVTFVLTPLTFLGGMFFPISTLPENIQVVAQFNPLLYLVEATRSSLTGALGVTEFAIVAGLLALSVLIHLQVVRDVQVKLRA